MKIYVDGTLIETRTVNPSASPYSNMTFTGKRPREPRHHAERPAVYHGRRLITPRRALTVTSQQSYATPEPEPTPTPDNGGDMSESDGSVTAHED